MNFSPKLKIAADEIKEILKKHDIGGSVILHTPGYGEHVLKIDPSYSAMKFKVLPTGITTLQIKIDEDEIGKKAAKKLLTDTVNLHGVLLEMTKNHLSQLLLIDEELRKRFHIDNTIGGTSSDLDLYN